MKSALDNYHKKNQGALPEQIIIYRDGVGGPTFQEKCVKNEINQIAKAIKTYAGN